MMRRKLTEKLSRPRHHLFSLPPLGLAVDGGSRDHRARLPLRAADHAVHPPRTGGGYRGPQRRALVRSGQSRSRSVQPLALRRTLVADHRSRFHLPRTVRRRSHRIGGRNEPKRHRRDHHASARRGHGVPGHRARCRTRRSLRWFDSSSDRHYRVPLHTDGGSRRSRERSRSVRRGLRRGRKGHRRKNFTHRRQARRSQLRCARSRLLHCHGRRRHRAGSQPVVHRSRCPSPRIRRGDR